jgi:uncharacterized protein (DUF2141 family)
MKYGACFVALLVSLSSTSRTHAGPTSALTINVSTFRSTRGALVCRLFAGPEGFPAKATYRAQARVPISRTAATCTFPQLASGTYAVGVFHDENGNGQLDTNFLGIPTEGVGVSNNKRPLIGPPSWNDAKFGLHADATLQVRLHY